MLNRLTDKVNSKLNLFRLQKLLHRFNISQFDTQNP